ncbi:MAG: hypothetical protein ACJ780_10310 [Solirubrobacteraceae bacterium]|jgi:hypothetical protein
MSDPLMDMETEVTTKPADTATYAAIGGTRGGLLGGGEVYMSHNRKQAVKARANGDKPTAFFTCDTKGMQQSVPYRAIAAGLTAQVIPVAHVATRYAKADLLRAFVGHLLANHPDELGVVLMDFAGELGELYGLGEVATPAPEAEPEMEGEEGA